MTLKCLLIASVALVCFLMASALASLPSKSATPVKIFALSAKENPDLTAFTMSGSSETVFTDLPIRPWEGRAGTASDPATATIFVHGTIHAGEKLSVLRLDLMTRRFDRRDIVEITTARNVINIQPYFHERTRTLYEWMIWEDENSRFVIIGKVCFQSGKFIEITRLPIKLSSTPVLDPEFGQIFATISYTVKEEDSTNVRIDLETGATVPYPEFNRSTNHLDWTQHVSGWNPRSSDIVSLGVITNSEKDDPSTNAWMIRRWTVEDGETTMSKYTFLTEKWFDSGVYDPRTHSFFVSMSIHTGYAPVLAEVCAHTGKAIREIKIPKRHVQIAVL